MPPGKTTEYNTEWQWPISGVHSIMMEKSALGGEGGVHFWKIHPVSVDYNPIACKQNIGKLYVSKYVSFIIGFVDIGD